MNEKGKKKVAAHRVMAGYVRVMHDTRGGDDARRGLSNSAFCNSCKDDRKKKEKKKILARGIDICIF